MELEGFIKQCPLSVSQNMFEAIGKKWMLITAGDEQKFNTMTASWGGMGVLWNKNVAFTFVRPQRYTFEFTEKSEKMTLCFFEERYRTALTLCGSKSGREIDKVKETGLTPVFLDGAVAFREASMIFVVKKLYADWIREDAFLSQDLLQFYPEKDFHRLYIGEIDEIFCAM